MKRLAVATILASVALCTSALGYHAWQWTQDGPNDCMFDATYPPANASDYWLSKNNGTPAVAMSYGDWTSVAVECRYELEEDPWWSYDSVLAFEWKVNARWNSSQGGREWPYVVWDDDYKPGDPCVVMNDNHKLWMCSEYKDIEEGYSCLAAWDDVDQQSPAHVSPFNDDGDVNVDHCFASTFVGPSYGERVAVVYSNHTDPAWGLFARTRVDNDWSGPTQVAPNHSNEDSVRARPSLAVTSCNGANYVVHCAYQVGESEPEGNPDIYYKTSTDYGTSWIPANPSLGTHLGKGKNPCVAAVGRFIFMCWHDQNNSNRIAYKFSRDAGGNWFGPDTFKTASAWDCDHTSAAVVTCGATPDTAVLLVSQLSNGEAGFVFQAFGVLVKDANPHIAWQLPVRLSEVDKTDPTDLRPSVVTQGSIGRWVYNTTIPGHKRGVYLRSGKVGWVPDYNGPWPNDVAIAGSGRLIAKVPDGSIQYASVIRPNVVSGTTDEEVIPMLVAPGSQPALALDGDGEQWIAYIYDDTVWVRTGDGSYEVVFSGSSSAVPGQPSIVCYPEQAGGVTVANVVFAVYDTAGGTSKIMYCRVDTGQVVQDTIESVNNLRDSLPSISVYATDTLLVTFQHGDSVLSVMLADYGPGTAGQVPAWSSPSLVTASGYHPMNVMENGSVLNCVWTQKSGNYYSIQRATNDLASAMFGNWTGMATPGSSTTLETGNSAYAGVGVSVYQQKDANGTWTIKGFVRGEETTLVANDTDACHPHAVAESSAVSPSIDRIALHLLYDAGVAFEVDSGVYDTGEVRYSCLNFDVSHAGSDATKCNNGNKLLRKADGDSLFAVYSDADGAVAYAWSAAGDSWQREIMATGRDYPAIAEDSSGMRWVVVRKLSQSINPTIQEAYYRNGSSWTGPETLYAVTGTTLGPAGLSGSSYTTSGIAYAAFLCTAGGGSQSIILAKFDGTNVSTYTVATGTTLGDPCITVEPYLADSDHVHVTWTDNGTIKYRMDTDGRSTSIAANWTSTYDLTGRGIVAQHPSINSDRDQIVVAWAQGSPTDVYSRKRSTASAYNNWDAAVNLSNTAQDASDWPVIAMGDTVVVAWEEARTGGSDYDILACIDFGDTLNIADNATFSTYPHVVFYNKASGDTAIPYVLTIFSETPSANYYEVAFNKLNLKQASGGGQQSASSIPIPTKPSLAACMPNPFRDRTQISYALPAAGNVSLRVYDVSGRTVRTLANGHQKAGSYSVTWDSKDSRGRQVARGVYFYRLDTPGFRAVKKAVVTR